MNLIDAIKKQTRIIKSTPFIKSKLDKLTRRQPVVLVALCGETAAGKTTLLNALKQDVSDLSLVSADNYFCDIADKIREYGSFTKLVESGYQTESSENFQMDLLRSDLTNLKAGHTIYTPYYEMCDGSSTANKIQCIPSKVVIVESICTLYPEVRDLFDLKIYLSIDRQIQWERYVNRAVERNLKPSEMKEQFEIVTRAAEKYIIPNQVYADMIVEGRVTKTNENGIIYPVCRHQIPTNQAKQRERAE